MPEEGGGAVWWSGPWLEFQIYTSILSTYERSFLESLLGGRQRLRYRQQGSIYTPSPTFSLVIEVIEVISLLWASLS